MRKLIEETQENLIECDTQNCGYVIPNPDPTIRVDVKEYINVPCPKCGGNLLTINDYNLSRNTDKIIDRINFWFSWITIFLPKKPKHIASIKTHNKILVEYEK